MRIGEFAKTNGLTKDTIRHYMDMGLIIPDKSGGQYKFTDKQQIELDEVIELKRLGFTLNEIKKILVYKMLGKLSPYEAERYYIEIYNQKYNKILDEIDDLKLMAGQLKEMIAKMEYQSHDQVHKMGVDIRALSLLSCDGCKGSLSIVDARIEDNQLIEGKLVCNDCKKDIQIVDGIIMVNTKDIKADPKAHKKQNYFGDYINEIDDSYLDNIYKMQSWVHNNYDFNKLKGKILLELGSGSGIFLRNMYEYLSDDTVYFAVDHDIERHRFVKYMLSHCEIKKNIVFICCDFEDIPINNHCVDALIDITGTSNYSFDNDRFLLSIVNDYLKDNNLLLATFIVFNKFDINSYVSVDRRKYFKQDNIISYLEDLGYNIEQSTKTEVVTKGGKYEDYFSNSEEVYTLGLFGSR